MEKPKTLLKTGIVGSAITALCCFTPILVVTLGLMGLSAIVGYLDYVLFPALGIFLMITAYAVVKGRDRRHEGERG
ncbi:MAG: mercury resistance system transport protein MerF [Candidatus Tectomicrobia bacterium]|nr:mercury resistance system transport protein MerF [Candidatus Tectomicrobia bacterium]